MPIRPRRWPAPNSGIPQVGGPSLDEPCLRHRRWNGSRRRVPLNLALVLLVLGLCLTYQLLDRLANQATQRGALSGTAFTHLALDTIGRISSPVFSAMYGGASMSGWRHANSSAATSASRICGDVRFRIAVGSEAMIYPALDACRTGGTAAGGEPSPAVQLVLVRLA